MRGRFWTGFTGFTGLGEIIMRLWNYEIEPLLNDGIPLTFHIKTITNERMRLSHKRCLEAGIQVCLDQISQAKYQQRW